MTPTALALPVCALEELCTDTVGTGEGLAETAGLALEIGVADALAPPAADGLIVGAGEAEALATGLPDGAGLPAAVAIAVALAAGAALEGATVDEPDGLALAAAEGPGDGGGGGIELTDTTGSAVVAAG